MGEFFLDAFSSPYMVWLVVAFIFFASIATFDKRLIQAKREGADHGQLPTWVGALGLIQYAALIGIAVLNWKFAIAVWIVGFVLAVLPVLETVGNLICGLLVPKRLRERAPAEEYIDDAQFRSAVSGQQVPFLPVNPPTLKSDGMLPGHQKVRCPACKSYFEVPDGSSGEINCSSCAALVSYSTPKVSREIIPNQKSESILTQALVVRCPNAQCGTDIEIPSNFDGMTRCTECGASFNHALLTRSPTKKHLSGRASWQCRCGHYNEAPTETCSNCQRAPNAII